MTGLNGLPSGDLFWMPNPMLMGLLFIALIWSLIWKGLALWRAAKNDSTIWFIVLLIVNTLGILEILYFFVFGRKKREFQPA